MELNATSEGALATAAAAQRAHLRNEADRSGASFAETLGRARSSSQQPGEPAQTPPRSAAVNTALGDKTGVGQPPDQTFGEAIATGSPAPTKVAQPAGPQPGGTRASAVGSAHWRAQAGESPSAGDVAPTALPATPDPTRSPPVRSEAPDRRLPAADRRIVAAGAADGPIAGPGGGREVAHRPTAGHEAPSEQPPEGSPGEPAPSATLRAVIPEPETPVTAVTVAGLPNGSLSVRLSASEGRVGDVAREVDNLRRRLAAKGLSVEEIEVGGPASEQDLADQ